MNVVIFYLYGYSPDKFNTISPLQQATMIWQAGVPVGELYDKFYIYAYIPVVDFYVEIKFCKAILYFMKCAPFLLAAVS